MINVTGQSQYLDSTQEGRIRKYYNNASIHVPNKFVVGFFGEYVKSALQYLADYCVFDPLRGQQKRVYEYRLYSGILTRWMGIHCPDVVVSQDMFSNGYVRDMVDKVTSVELLWACEDIKFKPSITPKIKKDMIIDTYKNIKYPIITGHDGPGEISLTINEDRTLMFYQFFNALMNQFFDPLVLKPRSSFHKLGMYMIVMDGFSYPGLNASDSTTDERGEPRKAVVLESPLQVFEFNSVVMADISQINYGNTNEKKATFNVTLSAPNMFQDPFKTTGNYRGLKNNTSSDVALDGGALSSDGFTYNKANLEEQGSAKTQKVAMNGNYKQITGLK